MAWLLIRLVEDVFVYLSHSEYSIDVQLVLPDWKFNAGSRRDVWGCAEGGTPLGVGAPGPLVIFLRILKP